MVRFLLITSSPLFGRIVPLTGQVTVSPAAAFALASRKRHVGSVVPGQFPALAAPSSRFVTVMFAADTDGQRPRLSRVPVMRINQTNRNILFIAMLLRACSSLHVWGAAMEPCCRN